VGVGRGPCRVAGAQARWAGGVSIVELELLRVEHQLSISRFCRLLGLDRSTYHRRRERERRTGHERGPWPAPARRRIEQPAAQLALEWPAWGHRKIWALLAADGYRTSQSTVLRALQARGLIQPAGYQRERRELARQRREAFVEPVTRRNRVWQMDFSEFETAGQGVWNLGGIVDYAGKLALGCPISATKTARTRSLFSSTPATAPATCSADRWSTTASTRTPASWWP